MHSGIIRSEERNPLQGVCRHGMQTHRCHQCLYDHIHVEGERLAVHEKFDQKKLQLVQVIEFDKEFFKGKKVLCFDDILTKGFSYARFALQLEKLGAEILGGFFIGKTQFQM